MYRYLRPLLFRLDAERAHGLAMGTAHALQRLDAGLTERLWGYEHEALEQELWHLSFPNPIGLAAGFDKNGGLPRFWEQIGFGFSEIGSVTHLPSAGNPRPRAFRLPEDRALINRMGLNNDGSRAVARRIEQLRPTLHRPLGINVAKSHEEGLTGDAAVEDFRRAVRELGPHADYVTLNLSCPNTPDGRTFEVPEHFRPLGEAVLREREQWDRPVPVLAKLGPPPAEAPIDEEVGTLVDAALELEIDGFVATNTASDRAGLQTEEERLREIGPGGLSGRPLAERATRLVRYLYRRTDGAVPIVGVGGIDSPEAAYRRIRAGASLLQLYTGLVYEGPGLIPALKRGLVEQLEADGYGSISEAVGVDAA